VLVLHSLGVRNVASDPAQANHVPRRVARHRTKSQGIFRAISPAAPADTLVAAIHREHHCMFAIRTRHLARSFAGGKGVHGIDLDVEEGSVYGFLGPNGAGKSTTIRLVLGLLRPDEGKIRLFGEVFNRSRRAALRNVGALVERPSVYPQLSARDNLEVTRRLIGAPRSRIDEVLEQVGLGPDAQRPVRTFSTGMRQRLGIALALLNRPRLLILDEPTNGLDPVGIASIRRFIQRMTDQHGLTVFVSSHLLAEIEQVATHVGVIRDGHLLFQGPLADLRAKSRPSLEIVCADSAAACADLRQVGEHPEQIDATTLRLVDSMLADHQINRLLVGRGHAVHRLARSKRSLEELFLELTGELVENTGQAA
jgi:ABC-2 type transport system ATP-binding protein